MYFCLSTARLMAHIGNSATAVYQGDTGSSRQEAATVLKLCKVNAATWAINGTSTLVPTDGATIAGQTQGFLPGTILAPIVPLGGGITVTLPTGAIMARAFPHMAINDSFTFEIANTDAAQTVTLASGASFALTGSGAVAPLTRVLFEVDRTAGATFACFRLYSNIIAA